MRDLVDASPCSPLPSSGYRGRPFREPCGSPPSTVLWVHTTARLPFPAASGLPWLQVLLAEGLFASRGTPSFPRDLVPMEIEAIALGKVREKGSRDELSVKPLKGVQPV